MRPLRTTLAFLILAGFLACTAPGCGGGASGLDNNKPAADPSKPLNVQENMPGFKDITKKQ